MGSDVVVRDIPKRGRQGELSSYEGRYLWLLLFCILAFTGITFRLWHIQVVEGEKYFRASTQNIIRQVEVQAPRGQIVDRNQIPLAENRPSFDVYLDPYIFLRHADEEVYGLLKSYLHLSSEDLRRVRQQAEARDGEVLVRRDVARSDIARLEEDQMRLPGLEVRASSQRHYPLHHVSAHTLGFVAEVSQTELTSLRKYGYRPGDYTGRMGLERAFDEILHGSPGIDRRVVDARGNRLGESQTRFLIGEYQKVRPIPGRNVVTTLDADLMVMIDEAVRDYPAAAVVAIDPRDGGVLAMYSKPHFNPNAWSGRLSSMEKVRSDNDPFRPMLDKTLNGYFPGSVYKIVGTIAALEDGIYEPHDEVHCPGHYTFGGRRFRCWRDQGHGRMDAYSSMAQSCDVYYYRLADEIGIDRIADFSRMFGFGERTGVILPRESAGRVPDRDWYTQNHPDGYQRGFDLNSVIGQGDTLTSPLQVAMAYAAIANGGDIYYPRLVQEVRNAEGRSLFRYEPRVRKRIEIKEENLEVLRDSLWEVVQGRQGTARHIRMSHSEVAGKTGTAQVATIGAVRMAHEDREMRRRNHAWFAAYAPFDEPEIALVVFLEHAGGGGGNAAPVAHEILDRYLTRENRSALTSRIGPVQGEGRTADDE